MKVNINTACTIKPTEAGWQKIKEKCPHYQITWGFKNDGYYTTELWDLMCIFGNFMYCGSKQYFEQNIIELVDSDKSWRD